MKTSIIVCSYGERKQLVEACMASLQQQTSQPDEVLLIVDTKEEKENLSNFFYSKDIPARVTWSGKKGLAAARNKGIEESIGDIIAFIDDDAIATKNWLSEIVKCFNSKNVVAAGGPVKPIFQGKKIKEKLNWIAGCTSDNPPTKRPIGCNMAFNRKIFKDIGFFDENLGRVKKKLAIGEETELFLRIKKHKPNAEIIFNPEAIVYHQIPEERTKLGYILSRAYQEGLAKAAIGKKHNLEVEQEYLKYYIKNLDLTTFLVLLSTGFGYVRGKFRC